MEEQWQLYPPSLNLQLLQTMPQTPIQLLESSLYQEPLRVRFRSELGLTNPLLDFQVPVRDQTLICDRSYRSWQFSEFVGIGLFIWKQTNVIVRNIISQDVLAANGDGLGIQASTNVWVDHWYIIWFSPTQSLR